MHDARMMTMLQEWESLQPEQQNEVNIGYTAVSWGFEQFYPWSLSMNGSECYLQQI